MTKPLTIILALFLILGSFYILATPIFEASDEVWHYPLVRHLADGNPLPVQTFDPAEAGPWRQQASQPPLYYYLAAAATFWIDTGDMDEARRLNPHVAAGRVTTDGNINLVVHNPQANPWQGTLLAVYIVRFLSLLLGAATVYLTYRLARQALPGRPEIALGAAALNAFLPMFLFISGAVNNDNLVIPLAALALLLMARLVSAAHERETGAPPRRSLLLLGLVIGLAALAKISGVGLLLLAWGTLFMAHWATSSRSAQPLALLRLAGRALRDWLWVLLPALLTAGWWYGRNLFLYGDWTGWNAFIAVLGQRPQPASLFQLWSERAGFLQSFWGLFGGLNVPMPDPVYTLLNGLLLASVAGFALFLARQIRLHWAETDLNRKDFNRRGRGERGGNQKTLRFFGGVQNMPLRSLRFVVAQALDFALRHFTLVLCLVWSAAVIYGLIQWATITWSSQGRLVFTALPALLTLMAVGLAGWLPRRLAAFVMGGAAGFFFLIAAAAPFLWIRPAYQPPTVSPDNLPAHHVVDANFSDKMRLVGYRLADREVRPGATVKVQLIWEALSPMERDWSIFVHLNDPALESPLAQRDSYPGQGLLAARWLAPGQLLLEEYHLEIPATAVAPAELTLVAGLYDFATGERLPGPDGTDVVALDRVALTPTPGELPNPLAQNFGNRLELAGYRLEPRRLPAGETMTLELYWRPLRPLQTDYTIFVQLLDQDTTRWASSDFAPPEGTSSWPAGEITSVVLTLTVDEATPAQVYPLIVGLYTWSEAAGFQRLQLVAPDGRVTDQDYLELTRARIDR